MGAIVNPNFVYPAAAVAAAATNQLNSRPMSPARSPPPYDLAKTCSEDPGTLIISSTVEEEKEEYTPPYRYSREEASGLVNSYLAECGYMLSKLTPYFQQRVFYRREAFEDLILDNPFSIKDKQLKELNSNFPNVKDITLNKVTLDNSGEAAVQEIINKISQIFPKCTVARIQAYKDGPWEEYIRASAK